MSYLGLAPERFARFSGLEQYFAMARGTDDVQLALDMSKYFDTNYRASVILLQPLLDHNVQQATHLAHLLISRDQQRMTHSISIPRVCMEETLQR